MVDTARQLLDELMGRNRNLDPTTAKSKKVQWDDPEFCLYHLVKFCPHDLFVNTRADLGQCTKLHDDEAKRLYEEARPSARKRGYEDEFLRFSNHMINEVDRKIEKGRQRLALMNKVPEGAAQPAPPLTKFEEMMNTMNARINKLIGEAEEAGSRGDVEQAQNLMTLCDQVKEEKDALVLAHENEETTENGTKSNQWNEYTATEKQMEVCEVCGAFLIVGDAQQRIEDHLSGKQHLGYSKLRKAIEEMYEARQKEREKEEKDNHRRDDFDRRKSNRPDRLDRRDRPPNRRDRSRDRSHFRDRRFDDRDRRDHRDHRDHRDRDRDRDRERERERDRDRDRDRRRRSNSRSTSRH